MRRYTDYKDSGTDWIGSIPVHWTIRRIKDVGAIQYGLGQPPEYVETGLPFVRATNVTKGKITDEGLVYVAAKDVPTSRNSLLRENDIIVVRSGANTADSALVPAKYAGAVAGYDMVIRAKSIFPHYLSYSLLSSYLLESQLQLQSFRAAQPHLNKEQLGHALVLLPPLPEQQAIADYLDAKTAQIDRKIDLLTQKAAKYRQLKQALINAAVTRGLDQSAPMKDSGVEWIGEVPAHWTVCRVKDELRSLDHKRVPLSGEVRQEMVNPQYDYYGASGVIDRVDDFIFNEPLILIGEDGANLLLRNSALAFVAHGKYWVNNHAHVLKPYRGNLHYFCYLLESMDYTTLVSGSAQPKLTAGALANIVFVVPPLTEQVAIATYLDDKATQIDVIVATIESQITKLQDLRKALINAVVTGKLRVT